MIDLGDPLPIQTVEVRDSVGALANAGAMALTVTLPDGTTATPGFSNPTIGKYVPNVYVPTVGGKYTVRWVGTGVNSAAFTEEFWVAPIPGVAYWPFASPDELRTWTGSTIDDLTDEKAWLLLDTVSGDIRDAAGWPITHETATFTADGTGTSKLFLPTLRLTAVTSVTVDGTALAYPTDYTWSRLGKLTRVNGRWPAGDGNVVVLATHGYPVGQVPASLKSLCLEHAARRGGYPDGIVKALRIDDYQEQPTAITLGSGPLEKDPRVPRVPVCA